MKKKLENFTHCCHEGWWKCHTCWKINIRVLVQRQILASSSRFVILLSSDISQLRLVKIQLYKTQNSSTTNYKETENGMGTCEIQ